MIEELVINSTKKGVEIALMHDKQLVELHREQGGNQFAVGDVYLGKVKKVIPSLNAAFVDVGYEKDAFLHYLDLGPQFSSLKSYSKAVMTKKQPTADLAQFKPLKDINKNGKIKEQLSGNMQVVVQVVKEPISAKGPRLTSEITIPGRYLVLVPFSNKISLSQRIKDDGERERLRRLLMSIKPANMGLIVRTVAENKKVAQLDQDLRDLIDRWNLMHKTLINAKPTKRILGEIDKTSAVLRDLLTPNFSNIYVNDPGVEAEVKNYLSTIAPDKEEIVKFLKSDDLFDNFKIHRQIKASFGKQVNLRSGAYLIVEHTEAMHVIDVNSGNRKGGAKNQEENALQTNLECAKEIARVLRLRDMGGIICIDFIDMQDRSNQNRLYEELKEAMKEDKAKHNVLKPSKFGVVEITRQRVRPVTDITTTEKCPSCNGSGKVEAPILILDELKNNIRYILNEYNLRYLKVAVHPMVESYLKQKHGKKLGLFGGISIIDEWKKKYGINIELFSSGSLEFLELHYYTEEGEEVVI